MADNSNQNQQKGGGGNQPKSVDGIQVGFNIGTNDLSRERMSSVFTIGLFGILGALGIAHLATPIKKHIFGIKNATEAKAPVKFGDVLAVINSPNTKISERKWAIKEAYGALPDNEKDAMKQWLENADKPSK